MCRFDYLNIPLVQVQVSRNYKCIRNYTFYNMGSLILDRLALAPLNLLQSVHFRCIYVHIYIYIYIELSLRKISNGMPVARLSNCLTTNTITNGTIGLPEVNLWGVGTLRLFVC